MSAHSVEPIFILSGRLRGSLMTGKRFSIGILLIVIAIILGLGKLGVFSFIGRNFWPLLVLLAGAGLHLLYFRKMAPSVVLIPAGMLLTYGIVFLYAVLFGWDSMSYMWPGFIFGIAVGLYEVYYFDRGSERSMLYGAIGLASLSVLLLGVVMLFTVGIYLIILLLILVGAFLIFRKPPRAW